MTELVMCPRCGDALDIPIEMLGKPVRCASCRTVFTPTPADSIPTAPRAARVRPNLDRPRRPAFEEDEPAEPKSNVWVWLVALGLVGVFGFIVFGCTGLFRNLFNPPMTVHTSEEGRFKVALPGAPSPISRTDDNGRPVVGLESVRPENRETYQVLSVEVPKELKGMKGEALLEELAKQRLPALATGAEVDRHLSTQGNLALLDVKFQRGGGFMKRVTIIRFVATGERVYALILTGANVEPNVWYVRRFFTSFEPLGK
jgi:hypothetical protein